MAVIKFYDDKIGDVVCETDSLDFFRNSLRDHPTDPGAKQIEDLLEAVDSYLSKTKEV